MRTIPFTSVLTILLSLFLAIGVSAQKSVDGEWNATFNTPGGPQPLGLIFKADGEKLTGTAKRSRGDVALAGTVKGEDITFSYTIDYNGNPVTLTFTGKVKGDEMSGTVSFNGQAEDEWGAKRVASSKPKN